MWWCVDARSINVSWTLSRPRTKHARSTRKALALRYAKTPLRARLQRVWVTTRPRWNLGTDTTLEAPNINNALNGGVEGGCRRRGRHLGISFPSGNAPFPSFGRLSPCCSPDAKCTHPWIIKRGLEGSQKLVSCLTLERGSNNVLSISQKEPLTLQSLALMEDGV